MIGKFGACLLKRKLKQKSRTLLMPSPGDITGLLRAWCGGDKDALEKLLPLVYDDLRRAARRYMAAENNGHVLQTTALVHETYLRLVDAKRVTLQNRSHFLAICAQLMRQILVDYGRSRASRKRGGREVQVKFNEALLVTQADPDLVELDEAMNKLAAVDERKSRVVEMRFFGGLSVEETAEVLKVSADTVTRDWKFAKTWLLRELSRD